MLRSFTIHRRCAEPHLIGCSRSGRENRMRRRIWSNSEAQIQRGDATQLIAALQSAAAMTHDFSSSATAGVSFTRASQALSQASSQTSLIALVSLHSTLTWPHTAVQSTLCPLPPPMPTLPPLGLPPEAVPPEALIEPPFGEPPLAGPGRPSELSPHDSDIAKRLLIDNKTRQVNSPLIRSTLGQMQRHHKPPRRSRRRRLSCT